MGSLHHYAVSVQDCAARRYLVAIQVSNSDSATLRRQGLQSIGIALKVGSVSLILGHFNRIRVLSGNGYTLVHPVDKMVAFRRSGGKLSRSVHRISAGTRGKTRFCRETVDRQSDKISADSVFRLRFHRFAIAHMIFCQYEEAVFHTRFHGNFRRVSNRINSIKLVGIVVDGIIEFVLFNAAAAFVILSRETGNECIPCGIRNRRHTACGRDGINGVQPCVGGNRLIDIEHNGGIGCHCVTRDAHSCLGLDGKADIALAAVQRIVDGQETAVDICGRQARGGVYGLEYPESLVAYDIQAGHHIHINAERITQINAFLVARWRALHSKHMITEAEAAHPEGAIVKFLVKWQSYRNFAC